MIFKSIAFRDDFQFRLIYRKLLEKIKSKHNSDIIVFVNSKEAIKEYDTLLMKGVIKKIIYFDELKKINLSEKDKILRVSRDIEQKIKFNINRLRMMHRSFGAEYFMGAPNLVRGPNRNFSYYEIINHYNILITNLINKLQSYKVHFFLNPGPTDEIICRSLKIKFKLLTPSRIENYWVWSTGHSFQPSNIKNDFNNFKKKKKSKKVILDQQYLHDRVHKKKLQTSSEIRLLKRIFDLIKRQIYYFYKPTNNRYYFMSFLKYSFCEYYFYKYLTSKKVSLLKDINQKYIFFPLSTEPENSLHVASQECFDQLNVIASISRDLPANIFLVIKESIYSLGSRSMEFYKKISQFKNVILVNINEPGLNLIKKSVAVANISGTAGLEAAILGKPVLNFGKNNIYDFVPHVFNVSTSDKLFDKISYITDGKFDSQESKKNGYFLKESIIKNSFDMGIFTHMNRDKFNDEHLETILKNLEKVINN